MSEEKLYRKTSYSEVQSWLQCQRQHYYSYGLGLTGLYNGEALERGIIGHAALAEYYRKLQYGFEQADAVSAAYVELARIGAGSKAYNAGKLVSDTATLLGNYFDHYKNERIEVLAVETEYSVGLLSDYRLPVRIDVVLRHLDGPYAGRVIAWDHKILKDFYDEQGVLILPQLKLYWAGLMAEGVKIDGVGYNMLRHRQTLSNKENPSERFLRLEVPTKPQAVRRAIEEHLMAANRIEAWKKLPLEEWNQRVLRNTSACRMCSFKQVCQMDQEGEDTTLFREYEFRQKTSREEMTY